MSFFSRLLKAPAKLVKGTVNLTEKVVKDTGKYVGEPIEKGLKVLGKGSTKIVKELEQYGKAYIGQKYGVDYAAIDRAQNAAGAGSSTTVVLPAPPPSTSAVDALAQEAAAITAAAAARIGQVVGHRDEVVHVALGLFKRVAPKLLAKLPTFAKFPGTIGTVITAASTVEGWLGQKIGDRAIAKLKLARYPSGRLARLGYGILGPLLNSPAKITAYSAGARARNALAARQAKAFQKTAARSAKASAKAATKKTASYNRLGATIARVPGRSASPKKYQAAPWSPSTFTPTAQKRAFTPRYATRTKNPSTGPSLQALIRRNFTKPLVSLFLGSLTRPASPRRRGNRVNVILPKSATPFALPRSLRLTTPRVAKRKPRGTKPRKNKRRKFRFQTRKRRKSPSRNFLFA